MFGLFCRGNKDVKAEEERAAARENEEEFDPFDDEQPPINLDNQLIELGGRPDLAVD